jgi:hypothetical protein
MTREVRKTISFTELIDDVGLIKPFSVGGEHTVLFKIIGNVGQGASTSMESFFTNDPFSLIVVLEVLASGVKDVCSGPILNPDRKVREIPVWFGVIAFSPDSQNIINIGDVRPPIQVVTIGFSVVRSVGVIGVAEGVPI